MNTINIVFYAFKICINKNMTLVINTAIFDIKSY